jgi:hypothetical protein
MGKACLAPAGRCWPARGAEIQEASPRAGPECTGVVSKRWMPCRKVLCRCCAENLMIRLIRGASSGDGADGQMIWIDSAGRLQSL